mmetsp:Transcript_1084/g.1984  ORF Transcript_1084/g.1984 Transcript_1084/m.1984 type:complete len:245 (-) Transcript_1084:271-1005(-)
MVIAACAFHHDVLRPQLLLLHELNRLLENVTVDGIGVNFQQLNGSASRRQELRELNQRRPFGHVVSCVTEGDNRPPVVLCIPPIKPPKWLVPFYLAAACDGTAMNCRVAAQVIVQHRSHERCAHVWLRLYSGDSCIELQHGHCMIAKIRANIYGVARLCLEFAGQQSRRDNVTHMRIRPPGLSSSKGLARVRTKNAATFSFLDVNRNLGYRKALWYEVRRCCHLDFPSNFNLVWTCQKQCVSKF